MKKVFRFKYMMLVYVALWIIATAVICWKLWGICANYQLEYEQAKLAANPDFVMDEALEFFSVDNIVSLATHEMGQLNSYEIQTNAERQVKSLVVDKKLTYQRAEKFSDRKPFYFVYADDVEIGTVQLKQLPESDNYGFHLCEVTNVSLLWDGFDLKSVNITIPQESSVFVNGEKVSDTYMVQEEVLTSMISKSATSITGKTFGTITYELDGFVEYPLVEVREDEKLLEVKEENGNYSVDIQCDQDLLKDMQQTIMDANIAYILNMNQMSAFENIAKYLLPNSKAYNNIQSAQSGIAWSGRPEKLDIEDMEISNILSYAENVFTVTTNTKVFRRYRGIDYHEEMKYEWLFEKNGDQWLISDFSYAN